tara:strand:- start:39 stop:647 length:609 start_codon:yes stop_codon:yes gene_type:complete
MALTKITKVGTSGLEAGHVGIRTAGGFVGTGFTILNFIGVGNTFAVHDDQVDISIAGGGGGSGGISYDSDTIDKVLFLHSSRFESDTSISLPQGFGEVFGHEDSSIVIEPGVTVDVDDDCTLLMTKKDDFDISFFGNPAQGTNVFRGISFDDNVRSTFASNADLKSGVVGYGKLPVEIRDEVLYNIENGIIVSVDDGALLVL